MKPIFTGPWLDEDRAAAQAGLDAAAIKLAEISGLAPDEAFYRVFGDITLEALPFVAGRFYGHVSKFRPRVIQLEIGQITDKLIWHELGHVLILTDTNKPNIADWLSRNVIKTASGRPVTGAGFKKYARFMGYRTTEYTGYFSIVYPDHQHTIDDDGDNPTEDICDMLPSLISGNIADNEAGQAIRAWVVDYLRKRLGL